MKKLILFNLSLLISVYLYATPIDVSTAVNTARNFYFSALNIGANAKDAPVVTTTESYFTNNKLAYYIVNFSNKGYVIVSADDDFFPVIAYSDEACLNISEMPPSMKWWLDNQAGDSEKANNPESEYSKSIRNAWVKYSKGTTEKSNPKIVVAPLLTCRWNQDGGYNYHCPEYPEGSGDRCVTGCVATAMAQIMFYHKYPEHGYGSHYYNHPYFGTLGVNFAETTYDWASMTNVINYNSKEAISTLIYHCGISVNMNYTPVESGAQTYSVPNAMVSNFNYSNRIKYLEKSDYDNYSWIQMLFDNLEMQEPVLYSGSGSGGGHAWVCDGVKDSSYFHFNWGWGGYGDGYFYLSSLNPEGNDFSQQQAAVMNISPYFYPYCLGVKEYNVGYKTFEDGSKFSLYWNNTDCDWLIAPDSADHVYLAFNSFATEQGHDILSIYDGENASAPLIGQYSGHDTPPMISSTGNRLYLRFTTDSSGQDQGWSATYSTVTIGVNENDDDNKLNIFPNPASGRITINLPSEISAPIITFYNLTGEQFLLAVSPINRQQLEIDVKDLAQGFYLIKAVSKDKTYIGKLLINH
jgi:hypothetical protein